MAYEHIIQKVHSFFDTDKTFTAAAAQYSLWKWHHYSHHIIVIATCRGLQYCFESCKITVTICLISISKIQTKGNCELIYCQKEDEIMREREHGKKGGGKTRKTTLCAQINVYGVFAHKNKSVHQI